MNTRQIYLVCHDRLEVVSDLASSLTDHLAEHGMGVVSEGHPDGAAGCELVVVLGGDGTILRAAEQARLHDIPLLGVNLGHVGFLAEAEPEALPDIVARIVSKTYLVEGRMTLDVRVVSPEGDQHEDWALNETAVNKGSSAGMVDTAISVDGRGLSSFGSDGVLISTSTGSTAYAFSAGAPVLWPDVAAILLVPIAAHTLFARPLVISPSSIISLQVGTRYQEAAEVWFDGRRHVTAAHGSQVEIRCGTRPLKFARLAETPFTARLVAKFHLPTRSWRDQRAAEE